MCGPFRASRIQTSDPTYCLSSILTVNITAAMNGSTLMCNKTDIGAAASAVVSMATTNVIGMLFICIIFLMTSHFVFITYLLGQLLVAKMLAL